MARNKTVLVVGIIAISTAAYLLFRYFKGKAKPDGKLPDAIPNSKASLPVESNSASDFPIKAGSNNALVKQLQAALGITADGAFGPKTQAALLAQTGKISITSQAEFNTIITTLQAKPIIAQGKARADQLTSQWAGSQLQLMATAKVIGYGVQKDAFGALHLNNKAMTFGANNKLSRKDWQPSGATTQGYLIVNCTSGEMKGLWKVDPAKMTLA